MLKRTFWFTVGTGVGVGATLRAKRLLRRNLERYRLEPLAARVGDDVRTAVAEGRRGMRQREAELRGRIPRAEPGPGP